MSKTSDIQQILEALGALGRRFHLHKHRHAVFRDGTMGKTQMEILMFLIHQESPPTMRDLAKHLRVTSGAVTQMIAPLLQKGFVQKHPDPADKRIVRIALTERARQQMKKMKSHYVRALTPAFAELSALDIRTLARILSKLSFSYDTRK